MPDHLPALKPAPFDVVIYHNPACGTSRNALAMIRNAGIEPHVVECGSMPAWRIRPSVLRDVPHSGLW